MFAGDKQLYTHVLPGHEMVGLWKLASYILELRAWCASRRLQLNSAKTALIWFGSRAALEKLSAERALMVDSVVITPLVLLATLVFCWTASWQWRRTNSWAHASLTSDGSDSSNVIVNRVVNKLACLLSHSESSWKKRIPACERRLKQFTTFFLGVQPR